MIYSVFGYPIECDLPLFAAELNFSQHPLIQIRKESRLSWLPENESSEWFSSAVSPHGDAFLHWRGIAQFLIHQDGKAIEYLWEAPESIELFNAYLLTQAISSALVNNGIECLHGTALICNQGAIAILGESGQGKSTLACGFLAKKYKLLSDDLIVFDRELSLLEPSLQRMKLYPDSADGRTYLGERIPLSPYTEKALFKLDSNQFASHPAPMRAFFILNERRSQPHIERLDFLSATKELAGHFFNTVTSDSKRQQQQFQFVAELASRFPVFKLWLGEGLSTTDQSIALIEDQIESL